MDLRRLALRLRRSRGYPPHNPMRPTTDDFQRDHVPHRQFKTDDGEIWDVWEVRPETAYNPFLREPWLCFENKKGERFRFTPIPQGWAEEASDAVLRVILSVAG